MNNKKEVRRLLQGEVVSDSMDKTVVVRIDRVKTHPLYKKQYVLSTKIKAHDEKNEYKQGDEVSIAPTKPMSKDKKYVVVGKVS